MRQTHVTGFSVKDNLGLELFFPRIFFCSSLTRFSCSFLIFCLSSSIKRCCSTMANLSSAYQQVRSFKISVYERLRLPDTYQFLLSFLYFSVVLLHDPLQFLTLLPLFLLQRQWDLFTRSNDGVAHQLLLHHSYPKIIVPLCQQPSVTHPKNHCFLYGKNSREYI